MSNVPRLVALALSCAPLAAQSFPVCLARPLPIHSRAAINDPRSHGSVGDQYLSLAEAILLTNRQLDENSLSAAERAQLGGFGTDIAWGDIDASIVPVITLERDLPILIDTSHGFTVNGSNGIPVIELGDTRGLVAESDFVDFSNLHLRGGEHGISITQSDTLFGSLVSNVEFEGQGVAGLRLVSLVPNAAGRLQVNNCRFRGLPTGLTAHEAGSNRSSQLEIFGNTSFENCGVGVDLRLGPNGSQSLYLNAMTIRGCADAFRVSALGTPRRSLAADIRYCLFDGTSTGLTIAGSATANTLLVLAASELVGPTAFRISPLGSRADVALLDTRTHGDFVFAGGGSGRLLIHNSHLVTGTLDLGAVGAPITIGETILDRIDLRAGGSSSLAVGDSRWIAGSAIGTTSAPITVSDSHTQSTALGANVTVVRPLAAAPLGTFDAVPLEPATGSTLTLSLDLPAGLDAWITFGRTLEFGTTLAGFRFYANPSALVTLPGNYSGQASVPIPIPNDPVLRGLDLFFQPIVFGQPGSGLPHTTVPPGRRVLIR